MINQVPDFLKEISGALGISADGGGSGEITLQSIMGKQGP